MVTWGGLGVLLAVAGALGWRCAAHPRLRWWTGIPVAVVTLTLLAGLGLIGTLIVQEPERGDRLARLGLRALFEGWPFIAVGLMLLSHLAALIGRRLRTPRSGLGPFLLTHGGMLIVALGMLGGAANHIEATLKLPEGHTASAVSDAAGRAYALGAALTLERFDLESFPPRLGVLSLDPTQPHGYQMATSAEWVTTGRPFHVGKLTGTTLAVLPQAMSDGRGGWVAAPHGVTAAQVSVTQAGQPPVVGWVTTGSPERPREFVWLPDGRALTLQDPAPRSYRSVLTLALPGHPASRERLEVNRPLRVGGWWLYQSAYELRPGHPSITIIQAVKDPLLPAVYLGLIAMLLGTLLTRWRVRRPQEETA
jgi:hypothetical protein